MDGIEKLNVKSYLACIKSDDGTTLFTRSSDNSKKVNNFYLNFTYS
jgi:hypothetical protein